MSRRHVAILGAGPAGLGAACRLTHNGLAKVSVLEQNQRVGGNAGSSEIASMRVDYGRALWGLLNYMMWLELYIV